MGKSEQEQEQEQQEQQGEHVTQQLRWEPHSGKWEVADEQIARCCKDMALALILKEGSVCMPAPIAWRGEVILSACDAEMGGLPLRFCPWCAAPLRLTTAPVPAPVALRGENAPPCGGNGGRRREGGEADPQCLPEGQEAATGLGANDAE